MKKPRSYLNLRVTLSGRERVEIEPKHVLKLRTFSKSGIDHYAVLMWDRGTAERLQVGTRGRLTIEGRDCSAAGNDPWVAIEDDRTFKVVSNRNRGGSKPFRDFVITFAAQPDA
jgi:hypothetical protein